jgi:hypothetical protein
MNNAGVMMADNTAGGTNLNARFTAAEISKRPNK